MVKNIPRRVWLIAGGMFFVALVVGIFLVVWQAKVDEATSPEVRYERLKQTCIDESKGKIYIRYPCESSDIKRMYKDKYSEEYTGAIAN